MKLKVIIRRCDRYDPQLIAGIIAEGMAELGVKPRGKVLVKPNVVLAHRQVFPHAFTRAEFLEGALMAAKAVGGGEVSELGVGERSGITVPTRFCFAQAGYPGVIKRQGAKAHYFDESPHQRVAVGSGGLRREVYLPKPVVEADFMFNLPKFKAHPWTRMTLSLKNFIGIQDDSHRLLDHNTFLEHKIADLNQAARQDFIAIDGIVAGQKMMLTPDPFDLGAIVMGTNPCAVDAVGCAMVGVEPDQLIHLKLASQRGLGPLDLEQIEIGGDFPLDEVRRRTENFQFCLERVDHYFQGGPLTCTVGAFPEAHSRDYCWGGCPGALQEAMHILRGFDPQVERKMGKVRYVVGRVEGPLNLAPDEKVLFAGACTSWQGEIDGKRVVIKPSYLPPEAHNPHRRPSNDMILKTAQAMARCVASRGRRWLHAPACTMSVADHVHYLSALGGVANPNFDPRLLLPINLAYLRMRVSRLGQRLLA
ncbi:MAG: DUF362 domain-containing protein [Proteobacteria bacterium]|nr:DUF362 domain-containing protein [Pseudomonadota bacterium]